MLQMPVKERKTVVYSIQKPFKSSVSANSSPPMFYYITVTRECDLKCTYCYGKACQDFGSDFRDLRIDYDIPTSIRYDVKNLKAFIDKDLHPTVIFYGGEPLLRIEKIEEIMDRIQPKNFMIQTNGLHLEDLEPRYLNRLHTILVSIDGDETQTDQNRGRGTYKRIMQNLEKIRKNGFKGEIIARMTVSVGRDVEKQVKHLLHNDGNPFTSVHWQLDAQFWEKDYDECLFEKWTTQDYNPQIRKLIDFWVEHMENHGEVLKIYPFLGVMESLLKAMPSKLRCGAGWIEFNIQTDGIITPCPVMSGMKDFYLGNIYDSDPTELMDVVSVTDPCPQCEIVDLCGGRCLYANVTRLWGETGFQLVCNTVRNLIHSLKRSLPEIQSFIRKGIVSIEDFYYTKYNSCEIIP